MKKKTKYIIGILSALLIIGLVLLIVYMKLGISLGNPVSREFNFDYKYGVMGVDELNTFKNSYTRDMVEGDPYSTKLELTQNEMNAIKDKVLETKFFQMSSYCDKNTNNIQSPDSQIYLKVQYRAVSKTVRCTGSELMYENNAKLEELINLIGQTIQSNEVYRNLPMPKGGYL